MNLPTFITQLFPPLLPGLLETWPTDDVAGCPCCLAEVLGTNSLFRLPGLAPTGGITNGPSECVPFGSSMLVVFPTLCLGVPTGEAESLGRNKIKLEGKTGGNIFTILEVPYQSLGSQRFYNTWHCPSPPHPINRRVMGWGWGT